MSSEKKFIVRAGDFFFKYRNAIFPLVLFSMFFITQPFFVSHPKRNAAILLIGALPVLFGQLFRLAVIGYAYIKRGGKDKKVYADDLVIRGFYAHSRNPMYVGNLAIVIGFALMFSSIWSYVFVIPFFIFAYLAITNAEEFYLAEKFGASYQEYVRTVPRFWPCFKGLSNSLKDFRYDFKRAIRKDYGNVFENGLCMIAICAWRFHLVGESVAVQRSLWMLVPLTIFYLIVRILKKTGRLATPNS